MVSGSQDGILAIWSLDTGECLCQKQLFGRIEVVKSRNSLMATAHFGIAFDMGCITIRQVISPVDLPVIFSICQVCRSMNPGRQVLSCVTPNSESMYASTSESTRKVDKALFSIISFRNSFPSSAWISTRRIWQLWNGVAPSTTSTRATF